MVVRDKGIDRRQLIDDPGQGARRSWNRRRLDGNLGVAVAAGKGVGVQARAQRNYIGDDKLVGHRLTLI